MSNSGLGAEKKNKHAPITKGHSFSSIQYIFKLAVISENLDQTPDPALYFETTQPKSHTIDLNTLYCSNNMPIFIEEKYCHIPP